MLLLEFDRGLFKFIAGNPAFVVLFQLPPRYGKRGKFNDSFPVNLFIFD